jgi:tetratricopeptide (TPR) repeat protein
VEGYRTDVRVCNLSYLQTDWYIDQMKRQAYESTPLPISWKKTDYIQGTHDIAIILKRTEQPWEVSKALDRIKSDDLRTKRLPGTDQQRDNIPTEMLYLPVDSAAVIASGIVKPENADWILKEMLIYFGEKKYENGEVAEPAKEYLGKEEMMVLNMLSNNKDWSRPFYYAITVSPDEFLRLEPYFRQDGVAYRIVPFEVNDERRVDTDILYDNLVNKYRWGNLEHPGLYMDENSMNMARTFRAMFGLLGQSLAAEGKTEKAKAAMDYGLKVLPDYNVPYDFRSIKEIASAYYKIGEIEKAHQLYDVLLEKILKKMNWYTNLKPQDYSTITTDVRTNIIYLNNILPFYKDVQPDVYDRVSEDYQRYIQQYEQFMQRAQMKNAQTRGGANR